MDQVQGQRGIFIAQHLGRVSFVLEEHNEIQVDAIPPRRISPLGPRVSKLGRVTMIVPIYGFRGMMSATAIRPRRLHQ